MFSNRKLLSRYLQQNPKALIAWCFVASFGAYFSMYAFRKPFNAAEYEGLLFMGMSLKAVFVISQVFGYMCSKFIGVKIISELKSNQRVKLIVSLIILAEVALLFFGIVPNNYKFIFLFLNGIPLGMVWGVVFSFLEGRKVTEVIATGLSVSAIVSSGFLKSFGRTLIEEYEVSDFWMPAFIGMLFMPIFLFFVWMLRCIPKPTESDEKLKTKRLAMTSEDRKSVFRKYGFGVIMLVLTYAMFLIFRDFRDNFAVEIWGEMEGDIEVSKYTWTELPIALIVVFTTAFLAIFKSNFNALIVTFGVVLSGLILIGFSTFSFSNNGLSPTNWMILNGLGLYMAYVPFQIVMYERFVALFRIKGNAGFFMYLSDSMGYLGSVCVLVYKEFFVVEVDWLKFFISISFGISSMGIICVLLALGFLIIKYKHQKLKQCVGALS